MGGRHPSGVGVTCEEALAALETDDPIHVTGEEMRRFIAVMDARR